MLQILKAFKMLVSLKVHGLLPGQLHNNQDTVTQQCPVIHICQIFLAEDMPMNSERIKKVRYAQSISQNRITESFMLQRIAKTI